MRTRSSSNFTNGHIKALIGRRIKISGTKKTYEYQVEHMDENEPKYFIEENLLRDLIHNSAFDEYERMERSGETNIRIVTKAAGNFTLKHSYKEENVETDLKENFEVKRKRSKETPVTNPSTNNNDYSSDESVEEGGSEEFPKGIFYGTTAYDPIIINGKKVSMADILKWSRLYNKFNNYKGTKIAKIFGRSHELCYDDVFDYKFYALTDKERIIVFTKSQIDFQNFFLPCIDFMKKCPVRDNEPLY